MRFTALLLPFLLLWPITVQAHPHVFVEPELTFVFDESGLAGLRQTWSFDEMFTVMMLEDYDTNGDNAFDARELAALKDGAFDNIREWGYFTYLTVGGKSLAVSGVSRFSARVEQGMLVYEFYVPLAVSAGTDVTVSIFDPDYYVDFLPPLEESVFFEHADGYAVSLNIAERPGAIASEWMINPTMVDMRFNGK